MNAIEFSESIEMLRSKDSMTYEDGFYWLIGHCDTYIDELIKLMIAEGKSSMRGKFVEIIGHSRNEKVIPVLKEELKHEHSEVRAWAYSALYHFENAIAEKIALEFKKSNPNEEFL